MVNKKTRFLLKLDAGLNFFLSYTYICLLHLCNFRATLTTKKECHLCPPSMIEIGYPRVTKHQPKGISM